MSLIEVTLYGEEIVHYEKTFLLEIPDGLDMNELDLEALSEIAEESGVGWDEYDCDGIEASDISVSEGNEEGGETVIKWQEEVA